MNNINRILIPVDFSKESEFALNWAINLLKPRTNTSLFLYHVAPPTPSYPVPAVDWRIDEIDTTVENTRSLLTHWINKVPNQIHADFILGTGSVITEVGHYCRTLMIDMIVVVARDHHGLSRWIRHNTCENIVRGATCPVLVLHHGRLQEARPAKVSEPRPEVLAMVP